jgi:peptidoglycan/LPS O-acetylase OafA/YrhL
MFQPDNTVNGRMRKDSFYRPGLDILRAVAFLLVFVAHGLLVNLNRPGRVGAIARSGEFGVCVFFFLSSYLITELLLREKRISGRVHIQSFYLRRILRIWPLYFCLIAVCWGYGMFSPSHTVSLAWALSLVLLSTNWYTAGHGYPPGFLVPLWSISVEEQFYLFWPFVVNYLSPRGLLALATLLIAAAYGALAILLHHGSTLDPGVWANSLVQFQFFALGTMTAIVLRGRIPTLTVPVRWGLFLGGLFCMRAAQAAVYTGNSSLPQTFAHIAPRYLVSLAGCLCLFFSLLQGYAGKLQRPLVYLGKISYGLYVFHYLWLGLARHASAHLGFGGGLAGQALAMALALPATVATAMVSYRCLESPFLRLKNRFAVIPSQPALTTITPQKQWRLSDVIAAYAPVSLSESQGDGLDGVFPISKTRVVMKDYILTIRRSLHRGGVVGIDKLPGLDGSDPVSRFRDL